MAKQKKKARQNKGVYMLMVVLVVLGVSGLFLGLIYPRLSSTYSNSVALEVPAVQVSLNSAEAGKARDVQAKFSMEIDQSLVGQVTGSELKGYITEIMATLDYDRIAGPDGTDYLKTEVQRQLGNYIDTEKLQRIYITHIMTGENLDPGAIPESSGRDKMFKRLSP